MKANPAAQKRFHKRLADLAKEKSEAPLDLLTELLLENRRYVGEEQWKQTVDIVFAIEEKLFKERKVSAKPVEFMPEFQIEKCTDLICSAVSAENAGQFQSPNHREPREDRTGVHSINGRGSVAPSCASTSNLSFWSMGRASFGASTIAASFTVIAMSTAP